MTSIPLFILKLMTDPLARKRFMRAMGGGSAGVAAIFALYQLVEQKHADAMNHINTVKDDLSSTVGDIKKDVRLLMRHALGDAEVNKIEQQEAAQKSQGGK